MVLSVSCLFAVSAVAANEVGFASAVKGVAHKLEDDTGAKVPLKTMDKIYENQTIVTGNRARVQLIFKDDSVYTIGRNTEVVINKFIYDPSSRDGASEVEAKSGVLKFVTGKIAKKDPKNVKVDTPFATIGVRGSGGIIQVQPNGQTVVGLTQCCLDVASKGSTGAPVPLDNVNHYTEVQDPDQPPAPPKPMPPQMQQQLLGELDGGVADNGDEPASQGDGAPANEQEEESTSESEEDTSASTEDDSGTQETAEAEEDTSTVESTSDEDTTTVEDSGTNDDGGTVTTTEDSTTDSTNETTLADSDGTTTTETQTLESTDDNLAFDDTGTSDGTTTETSFDDSGSLDEGTNFDTSFENDDTAGTGGFTTDTTTDTNVDTTTASQDTTQQETTTTNTDPTVSGQFAGNYKVYNPSVDGVNEYGDVAADRLSSAFAFEATPDGGSPDGTQFTDLLPYNGTAGSVFNIAPMVINNSTVQGRGYTTQNSDMFIYALRNTTTNERYFLHFGNQLTLGSWWDAKTGISLYNFMKDPVTPLSTGVNVFDYNTVDGPGLFGQQNNNLVGLAIDWDKQQYATGFAGVYDDGAGTRQTRFSVSIGNVDQAGTNVLEGDTYTYMNRTGPLGNQYTNTAWGTTASEGDVFYGDQTNEVIDGFVMESGMEAGLDLAATDTYDTYTPTVLTQETAPNALTAQDDGSLAWSGYSAGFVQRDIDGTNLMQYVRSEGNRAELWLLDNVDADSVADGANLSIQIQPYDIDTTSYSGVDIHAQFGEGYGGITSVISDEIYAGTAGTLTISSNDVSTFEGAFASDAFIDTPDSTIGCQTCQHLEWGVWAANFTEANAANQIDGGVGVAHLIPYVVGDMTQGLDLGSTITGTATYQGTMFGAVVKSDGTNSALQHAWGSFSSGVDFDNAQITSFLGQFADRNFSMSGGPVTITGTGDNNFQINLQAADGGAALSGFADGSLFGPTAQEMGGEFGLTTTDGVTNIDAGGIFAGQQQ